MDEFTAALADETVLTASLTLALRDKLERILTNLKFVDVTNSMPLENHIMKFTARLRSVYTEESQLGIAEYFDPRVPLNKENLDFILATLKRDHQLLNTTKSGLDKIFAEDNSVRGI